MKALFVLPQIATLVALYLFQDILSPLKQKISYDKSYNSPHKHSNVNYNLELLK